MRVLTPEQEELLSLLIDLAGDPVILQDALKQMSEAPPDKRTLKDLVRRIMELKQEVSHA